MLTEEDCDGIISAREQDVEVPKIIEHDYSKKKLKKIVGNRSQSLAPPIPKLQLSASKSKHLWQGAVSTLRKKSMFPATKRST